MVAYSVLMFVFAAVFFYLGIRISKGKTDLIHFYHQRKVKDKTAYGKDFGKAIFVIALGLLFSGVMGLLGEKFAIGAVIVMAAGILAGLGCIFAVQKKYNNGIF